MSALDGWIEAMQTAVPWAWNKYGEDSISEGERAAASIILGIQGLVRDLENRALTAERKLQDLTSGKV